MLAHMSPPLVMMPEGTDGGISGPCMGRHSALSLCYTRYSQLNIFALY
jgi:hypothetical protein